MIASKKQLAEKIKMTKSLESFGLTLSDWDNVDNDLVLRAILLKRHIANLIEITPLPKEDTQEKIDNKLSSNQNGTVSINIYNESAKDDIKTTLTGAEVGDESVIRPRNVSTEAPLFYFIKAISEINKPSLGGALKDKNVIKSVEDKINWFHKLDRSFQDRLFALASADVLIDIAQVKLTKRADENNKLGKICAFGSLITLILAIIFSFCFKFIKNSNDIQLFKDMTGHELTIIIFEKAAFGGLFLIIAYYFASLSKSFFHEGARLYNQRQSLRIGRIIVYLEESQVEKELLYKIFDAWADRHSAFQDIDTGPMSKGPTSGVNDLISKIGDVFRGK